MESAPEVLKDWLKLFSKAVRERDLDAGKSLFRPEVISYGTVCFRAENLEELVARQWQMVWPVTRDFDFQYATVRAVMAENIATLMVDWESTCCIEGQTPRPRIGRATIVLQQSAAGWHALHTHFSIEPSHLHDPVFCHPVASSSRPQLY